jgi:hypothetical protein
MLDLILGTVVLLRLPCGGSALYDLLSQPKISLQILGFSRLVE